jgi:glutamyl-Q tRNA(Asp) synthetase
MIIGRFAPTPSGPLHMGSLVTAVASYCDAKSQNGQWLLRVEDVDTPRVVKGSADDILRTLDCFGFEWDGEVLYQSARFDRYEQTIQDLIAQGQVYACACSRKSLQAQSPDYGPLGLIYPGTCRSRHLLTGSNSLRLDLGEAGRHEFDDLLYGHYGLDLTREVGDIVLKRVDGIYAYHLAVTLDDADQGVNQIVRGVDLLEVTPLHIYLNRLLGLDTATYLHLPLVKTPQGKKLSKQTGATALQVDKAVESLLVALEFLGQAIDPVMANARPAEILRSATENWDRDAIPNHAMKTRT